MACSFALFDSRFFSVSFQKYIVIIFWSEKIYNDKYSTYYVPNKYVLFILKHPVECCLRHLTSSLLPSRKRCVRKTAKEQEEK